MTYERSSISAFPRPQTSLAGRVAETAAMHDLLARPDVRLVTLTGPDGAGKTRLALHAALTVDGFPDGRWFIELAGISDPGLILPRIAQETGAGAGLARGSQQSAVSKVLAAAGLHTERLHPNHSPTADCRLPTADCRLPTAAITPAIRYSAHSEEGGVTSRPASRAR